MRGSCCSRVRICGMRWCCDPADPKWPSDVPHITAQQWCGVKGSKLRVPVVWSRERERKKGKERGGTSPAPCGGRSLGCGTTCASGSSWESKEHREITNLWAPGLGEGQKPHLPAGISSQPPQPLISPLPSPGPVRILCSRPGRASWLAQGSPAAINLL